MSDTKYSIVSNLAQFLRKNGDRVIDGSCKLSLTTSALCLLNTIFAEVGCSETSRSRPISNIEVSILEDVEFLSSFMRITSSLKLFHQVQTLRGGVDLSHFSNLSSLELRKIPAHLIIGLDLLSSQLRTLICSRSIYLLKELFSCCIENEDVVKRWSELRALNLSYNYLETLDHSIRCLPNLEVLDLSHNHIKSTEGVEVLEHLNVLNLSFNELEALPILGIASCRTLNKLYIRSNNLENLDGVDCLFNLEELDVSYNLLSDYNALIPLAHLKVIRILNFEGNPIYFSNNHTNKAASYLNASVRSRGLQLNGKLFVQPSSAHSPSRKRHSNHQTAINTVVGDVDGATRIPDSKTHFSHITKALLEDSIDEQQSVSSVASYSGSEVAENVKSKPRKKRKKSKKNKGFREALINDSVDLYDDDNKASSGAATTSATSTFPAPSHIQAKLIAEARRQERGESWLIPDNSFKSMLPRTPANTPIVSSSILTAEISVPRSTSPLVTVLSSTPNTTEMLEVTDIAEGVKDDNGNEIETGEKYRRGSKDSDGVEVLPIVCDDSIEVTFKSDDIYEVEGVGEFGGLRMGYYEEEMDLKSESDEENEDCIFFAEKMLDTSSQSITIVIGANYIKEKDMMSGKIVEKLDLNCLQSVQQSIEENKNEVNLEFDTIRTANQQRCYQLESEEAAVIFVKTLQPFAEAKTLKDATLGALECVKCKSRFSKQVAHKKLLKTKKPQVINDEYSSSYNSDKEYPLEIDACPNCGNHILVEMESFPLPSTATPPSAIVRSFSMSKAVENSPDVSVGSGSPSSFLANLFASIKVSPILKRKSVVPDSDIDIKVDVSEVKQNEDAPNSGLRRNSSDVTILSNPSQSSFTVIPDPMADSNLNIIEEKDSLASLSPPFSHSSLIYKNNESQETSQDTDNMTLTHDLLSELLITQKDNQSSLPYISPQEHSENHNIDETAELLDNLISRKSSVSGLFHDIHHRLKLHLEINIFRDEEQLEACLQTSIVPLSTTEEFPGLFVLSSKKIYMIKFSDQYFEKLQHGEPIEKIMQIVHSSPLKHLKQVQNILGSQGISLVCGVKSQVFVLVIRDADICNALVSLLTEYIKDHSSEFGTVDFLSNAEDSLELIRNSIIEVQEDSGLDVEILLHLFAFWNCELTEKCKPVCLIVTSEDILVTNIQYTKQDTSPDLRKCSIYQLNKIDHKQLSDLELLKLSKGNCKKVELTFLENSVTWTVETATESALHSFINALKSPWEELFGIQIPLTQSA